MHPAVLAPRNVFCGEYSDDAGETFGPAHIHFQQARVRVTAPQRPGIKHSLDVKVIREDAFAGRLLHRIGPRQRMADRLEGSLNRRCERNFLTGSLLDGPDDRVMPGATTDVPFVTAVDIVERWMRILFEQRDGGHDEARRAKTALRRSLLYVGALNGMKTASGTRYAFDCDHLRSLGALDRHNARAHGLAVFDNHAASTMASGAAILRACQPQLIANYVHQ
jgi:hypothetical protein